MINNLFNISLNHYIILFLILLFIGTSGMLLNKNVVNKLISAIIFINVISANFVVFANYVDGINLDGMVFAIIILLLFILNVILALSLILWIYKRKNTLHVKNEEKN